MSAQPDRLAVRVSPEQRAKLESAASLAAISVSGFVVEAAVDRAEALLADQMSTGVPAGYFDQLVNALDRPDRAPTLTKAAKRVARRPRIAAR
ncbi:MAG: DUF1778 domain-containing protein [Acidimicrobiia bacterium]